MNSSPRAVCFGLLATCWLLASTATAAPPSKQECLDANELALLLEADGKLLEERAALVTCAAATCPAVVRDECVQRIAATNAAIPTIIFSVKDATGQDLSAVEVTVDGRLVTNQLTGVPLEVNPGARNFQFKVANQPVIERRFVLQSSQKNRHEDITFEVTPKATADAPVTAPPASALPPKRLGAQRTAALVVGGLGVVGAVVGGVYGGMAMARKSDAEAVCPDSECDSGKGSSLWHDAKTAGNVSTIAFAVGGVALATGAVLWFTAGPRSSGSETVQPSVGLGLGTVQLKGSF